MTKQLLVLLVAASFATALLGCGSSSAGGAGDVNMTDANNLNSDRAIAQKAGGKWENLSPTDQKHFLDRAGGSEQAARAMVSGMGFAKPANMNKTGS